MSFCFERGGESVDTIERGYERKVGELVPYRVHELDEVSDRFSEKKKKKRHSGKERENAD